jgi:hypothetical protein
MDTTPGRNVEFERADALFWEILDCAYNAGVKQARGDTQNAAAVRNQLIDEQVPRYREQIGEICGVEVDPHMTPANTALAGVGVAGESSAAERRDGL